MHVRLGDVRLSDLAENPRDVTTPMPHDSAGQEGHCQEELLAIRVHLSRQRRHPSPPEPPPERPHDDAPYAHDRWKIERDHVRRAGKHDVSDAAVVPVDDPLILGATGSDGAAELLGVEFLPARQVEDVVKMRDAQVATIAQGRRDRRFATPRGAECRYSHVLGLQGSR